MRRVFLPRHFLAAGLLLLVLASLYVFFEAQRLQQEFLRQTEDKGTTLAKAMEASVKNAIVGNALLEDLIGQRLLDNARLIDQLLLSRRVDQALLKEVSAMNRLRKIDLLDQQGQPWELSALPALMARQKENEELFQRRLQTVSYIWGKRWRLARERAENQGLELPPRVTGSEFWKGSVFGVAIGARSFPGIIAVHANADYVLNFEKEMGVQRQIEDLGRHSDSEFIALLDSNLNVVAHTDRDRIGQQEKEPLVLRAKVDGRLFSEIVESGGGKRYFEVVKPVALDESNLGFLKIGLSLGSMEVAWHNSLRAIITLGLAVVAAGILGMAAIFHNQHLHLQEVKALEIEVLHRERLSALGNMAATVAHEVRNPLNAISIGLQRLKAEFQPTDDQEQYSRVTELMLGEVHRLNSIVEQFLSLARPLEIKPEALQVQDVLNELATLVEGEAHQLKVQIRVVAPPTLPPLKADREYLRQTILNLILNGLQAMPEGGTLTLKANTSNGNFLISVTDTGIGIAPENLRRIFEPYFTTKAKGSGLGLAIARRIIEAHGGTITVLSETDQGCCFQICLPLDRTEV
ncbi:MAG TPA: ATP-binding protein [Candidatus Bathyarchaeia archaeon]|nr:ATP-binding protein [Candidatus Bathyarchaeia archaeon]